MIFFEILLFSNLHRFKFIYFSKYGFNGEHFFPKWKLSLDKGWKFDTEK